MTEVLIADEIVLDEGEAECFRESTEEVAMVHFRREERDILGAIGEMMGILIKIVEHRARGDAGGENKYEGMPPEPPEKILVGKNQNREKEGEDERSEAKGDIGMETETE